MAASLHMTLSDIAALAKVQRPVVSMWRTRSVGTESPFPEPVATAGAREMFDAAAVVEWLAATGRGNNADAANDVVAFATQTGLSRDDRTVFDAVTALIALQAVSGRALASLGRDELLDLADESDPDDAFLYSELEASQDADRLAEYTDLLIDSHYSAPAAFEALLADRFRAEIREHASVALTGEALDLVSATAIELARQLESEPVFVDPTPGGSDLLLRIAEKCGEAQPLTVLTPDGDDGPARLVRRRLAVYGVDRAELHIRTDGAFDVHGPAVHVAQFPSPGRPAMGGASILDAIDAILLQMDDQQRAVIIAPASVLCDGLQSRALEAQRSGLLRSGRLRAIVRLPQGLLRSKPREAQALWILGPSFADVEIADRWTMVAELSGASLTPDVSQDLIGDIAASMGNRATVHAHSFRFARLVPMRLLLASRGDLTMTASQRPGEYVDGAPAASRIDSLLHDVGMAGTFGFAVDAPADAAAGLRPATVQDLLSKGKLRYVNGTRVDPAHMRQEAEASPAGIRIIGVPELMDPHGAPRRRIALLELSANYPSGALTHPGDIVFCTSPRPAAIVDAEGSSVVVFPARVLRIDDGDPDGLVPHIVAADINGLPSGDKRWRHWRLRRTADSHRRPLEQALGRLQHEQALLRQRLEDLSELTTLILDGVAGGTLSLTGPEPNTADPGTTAVPNEGAP